MTAPTTYPQHGVLDLPPFASLSPREQALHLVYDHGFDAAHLADVEEEANRYGETSGYRGTDHDDEHAVGFFATSDPQVRIDWHAGDHDEYDRQDPGAWPSRDSETGTSNSHRHLA